MFSATLGGAIGNPARNRACGFRHRPTSAEGRDDSPLAEAGRRLLHTGSRRLQSCSVGGSQQERPVARSVLRRWPIHRLPPEQRWCRAELRSRGRGQGAGSGRNGPRSGVLRVGGTHLRAIRMCGGQSTVHSLPDVQGRSADACSRAVRGPGCEILRAHRVMGAVPRGDGESAESGWTHGIRCTGVHRPRTLCRTLARLPRRAFRLRPGHCHSQEAVSGTLGRLLAASCGRLRGEYEGALLLRA